MFDEAIAAESTDIILITPETALEVFTDPSKLDPYLQKVKEKVEAFNGDISTSKGRKEIASFAYTIAQAKTRVDAEGKKLSAYYKEMPKKIDAGRKQAWDFLENMQRTARKPLDEWEAEQARIKAEEEARVAAEELAKQKEIDHEQAILENELFDIKRAEEKRLAEEAKIKREEEIRREAAEQARKDAEAKAERERIESVRREAEAKLAAERAEKEKAEAQERAKLQAEKAERDRIAAAEQAEKDKQAAIEAERKRIADEEATKEAERLKREADEQHRNDIKAHAVSGIKTLGFSEKAAISIINAIELGSIPHVRIIF